MNQVSLPAVPLRRGPPTREELLTYYPAKFTWSQLKTFVNSGYEKAVYFNRLIDMFAKGSRFIETGQEAAETI
jgi:hypothetical protein